jgi:hypothetical protein
MTNVEIEKLLDAQRAKHDPFAVNRGLAVIHGSGHGTLYIYKTGDRMAAYGQILMLPESGIERRQWQREYWRILHSELSKCLGQLQGAVLGAYGVTTSGFVWPVEPDWLAAHVGRPPLDKWGRPDNQAALARLTDLVEAARQELLALDAPPPEPTPTPPPPPPRQEGVLYGQAAWEAAKRIWEQHKKQAETPTDTAEVPKK